jgi:pyruvate kinase
MLSGETAVGKYPLEAVRVMRNIVRAAEDDFDYSQFFYRDSERQFRDVPSSVTLASLKTAYASGAKAIFIFSSAGGTVRLMSRLRPSMPILSLTGSQRVYHRLASHWGAVPIYAPEVNSFEEAFAIVRDFALEHGYVEYGDLVVVTAGAPFGVIGTTNTMIVESIGNVLVRGYPGHGKSVAGDLSIFYSAEQGAEQEGRDRIMLLTRCDDKYLPLLKQARGVILQNGPTDIDSEKYLLLVSKALDLPVVVRANLATHVLREGQTVTIDPSRGLIYDGIVE